MKLSPDMSIKYNQSIRIDFNNSKNFLHVLLVLVLCFIIGHMCVSTLCFITCQSIYGIGQHRCAWWC